MKGFEFVNRNNGSIKVYIRHDNYDEIIDERSLKEKYKDNEFALEDEDINKEIASIKQMLISKIDQSPMDAKAKEAEKLKLETKEVKKAIEIRAKNRLVSVKISELAKSKLENIRKIIDTTIDLISKEV